MRIADASRKTGLGWQSIEILLKTGVLLRDETGIQETSLSNLHEGEHYVTCLKCGKHFLQLSQHLPACGLTEVSYLAQYPNAVLMSDLAVKRRAKTPAQKQAQSEKLKARFQTPEGAVTRQQISEASRRMQESEYGERAAQHLRALHAEPGYGAQKSKFFEELWASEEHRSKISAWQQKHRDEVLTSAANARQHIQKHFTKPHATLKEALVAAGLEGFITEHKEGFYSIDEARPDLRLAVEVDGCYWHGCPQCGFPGVDNILNTDSRKMAYLTNRGWTILRFPEHEIKADLAGCVCLVQAAVEHLTKGAA